MYAVIETGGKQYRVAVGDRLRVETLKLEPGASLSLDKVLLVADGGNMKVGDPYIDSKVEATVVGHGRGDKVRILKLRRRQNSRTHGGHRQNYTELEIVSIEGESAQPKAERAEEATVTATEAAVEDIETAVGDERPPESAEAVAPDSGGAGGEPAEESEEAPADKQS